MIYIPFNCCIAGFTPVSPCWVILCQTDFDNYGLQLYTIQKCIIIVSSYIQYKNVSCQHCWVILYLSQLNYYDVVSLCCSSSSSSTLRQLAAVDIWTSYSSQLPPLKPFFLLLTCRFINPNWICPFPTG